MHVNDVGADVGIGLDDFGVRRDEGLTRGGLQFGRDGCAEVSRLCEHVGELDLDHVLCGNDGVDASSVAVEDAVAAETAAAGRRRRRGRCRRAMRTRRLDWRCGRLERRSDRCGRGGHLDNHNFKRFVNLELLRDCEEFESR